MKSRFIIFALILCAFSAAHGEKQKTASKKDTQAGIVFFENKIRPVLVNRCYECHSEDAEKLGGKLLLDTKSGMMESGESGPSLVKGKPDNSLVIKALKWDHDLEMPPDEPLSEAVISDFVKWVKMGAPDPRSGKVKKVAGRTYKEGELWSFESVKKPAIPEVKASTWARNPIDRFVLAQIEGLKLPMAKDASPEVLIRRLYFDLIGLPPDIEEMETFIVDYGKNGQQAVARLVDGLLASPQFGERWGRHWLDVARYGESNGNDGLSRNPTFPHAWRYRDYVIAAFNEDTPYDRFLTEQIAGDLLPSDSPEQSDRNLIATGFLALGSKPAKAMNNNFTMDVVADQIEVISRGVMGLSVGCARCHDHKFDPIPTKDYYALAGYFTSSQTLWGVAGNEKLTAPPTDLHVLKAAPKVMPPEGFVETVLVKESNTGKPKAIPKPKWAPGTALAMGVRDRAKPADCMVNLKGDAKQLGESVSRGFLSAVKTSESIKIDPKQSGRLQLAQWLTSDKHPQTARVMANRVWLHLFGKGIVSTPNDFGVYGARPTHRELLDHLATKFVSNNWSVKSLIREIVLSRTYQLSSETDKRLVQADPENLWLTRHNRRRFDAESLRDSVLKVTGQLDLEPGEGSIVRHRDILVNLAGNLHQPSSHRSVYLCYLRNSPPPELNSFDLPDFTSVLAQRETNTLPSQALFLFNSPFVVEQAGMFARKILSEVPGDDKARVKHAYQSALNRDPEPEELYRAIELVNTTQKEVASKEKAWASLCQALLVTNEFRYID